MKKRTENTFGACKANEAGRTHWGMKRLNNRASEGVKQLGPPPPMGPKAKHFEFFIILNP